MRLSLKELLKIDNSRALCSIISSSLSSRSRERRDLVVSVPGIVFCWIYMYIWLYVIV